MVFLICNTFWNSIDTALTTTLLSSKVIGDYASLISLQTLKKNSVTVLIIHILIFVILFIFD